MNEFRWLFIDDERSEIEHAKQLNETVQKGVGKGNVEVETAASYGEAERKIYEGFFQLAVSDLYFASSNEDDRVGSLGRWGGIPLLRSVKEIQQDCVRVVRSSFLNRRPESFQADEEVLQVLGNPISPLVSGMIPKGEKLQLKHVVSTFANEWLQSPTDVSVPGHSELARHLDGWRSALFSDGMPYHGTDFKLSDEVLTNEIKYLVSRICGQGRPANSLIEGIDVQLLSGGASSALLLVGRPLIRGRLSSVWLVFKIDLVSRAMQEMEAFERHVKFQVGRARRVEVIGSAKAARLGAVAYTFAGKSPEEVQSLKQMLSSNIDEAEKVIDDLLTTYDFHSVSFDDRSVRDYAEARIRKGFNLDRVRLICGSILEEVAEKTPGWNYDRDSTCLSKKNKKICIPREICTHVTFENEFPYCICHGDLHAGNVVMGRNGERILIDYRETGPGPRALDYVSLQASVKLNASESMTPLDILESLDNERALWRAAWRVSKSNSTVLEKIKDRLTPPQRVALLTMTKFKENFFSNLDETDAGNRMGLEFATVGFCWCSYLLSFSRSEDDGFKGTKLGTNADLIIVIWMDILASEILTSKNVSG